MTRGARYVALDVPRGATLAMDGSEFACDADFAGVRGLAPGVHFVAFAAPTSDVGGAGERVGEFVECLDGMTHVRRWESATESLGVGTGMGAEDAARVAAAAARGELDRRLVVYPRETSDWWLGLSSFIDRAGLRRCGIDCGTRIAPGDPDAEAREAELSGVVPYFDNIQRAPTFTRAAVSRAPKGKRPEEVSALNLDPEVRLRHALKCFGEDGWRGLLGELQLAFVLLIGLSSMAALEQWKHLAHVVCACAETAVFQYPELYSAFIDVIGQQLKCAGDDFFADDYSDESFLRPCLVSLMRIDVSQVPEMEMIDSDLQDKLNDISSKLERLDRDVLKKFDIHLSSEALDAKLADADADEEGEDAPVIVELSEGTYMAMNTTSIIDNEDEDTFAPASDTTPGERMAWMVN